MNYSISVTMGQKLDEHILVGTPKEIATLRILGGFDMDDVETIFFDDADIIVTTDIVQRHLMNGKPGQQIVFATATQTAKMTRHLMNSATFLDINEECDIFDTVAQHFIKCEDFDHKVDTLRLIIDGFRRKCKTEKILIFCNVSDL